MSHSSHVGMQGSEYPFIPLHQNESYWLLDQPLIDAYRSADNLTFSTYPKYDELTEAIARYARVQPDRVLLSAGSDAAIRLLAELYRDRRARVLLPIPTFYGYEKIFEQVGLQYDTVAYSETENTFAFPTEEVERRLANKNVDVVFLCQPNNPLGALIPESAMQRLLSAARKSGTVLIVDEAYFEFTGVTEIARIDEQPLIVLRTLSKAFGLAGARVGYCIADTDTIEELRQRSLPWPIAHSSVRTALVALDRAAELRARLQQVISEREHFQAAIAEIPGVAVYASDTNFLFVRTPDAMIVHTKLAQQKIYVALCEHMSRHESAKALLSNALRIGIPAPVHREVVIGALRGALDRKANAVV